MRKIMMGLSALALTATLGACAVPAEENTVKPAKRAGKAAPKQTGKKARTVWGNGIYKVGSEIKPGEYQTEGSQSGTGCYWERLKGTSGEIEEVIASDVPSGPSRFTVKKTDKYIKLELGCEWTRVK